MTRCTRWFLPLLLLPLPTAPPYFLVLFLFSLTMHAKPCFYCIILLTTLFISSCYWQPFPTDTPLSTPWSENISTFADAINATLSPKYPLPHPTVIRAADRCWCDFTSGTFFEPFNVSHWEYLSVQHLKDSLEKRQKASEDFLRELMQPRDKLERDLPQDGLSSISYKLWTILKDMSPGFYNSFSNYMLPSEEISEPLPGDTSSPPPSPLPPDVQHSETAPPSMDVNTTDLPLIRKKYDLRPYGFNMVLDFSWS
ncbi:hypothetical protein AN958_08482 [Leucoagaricus sp. SymC.cos]|nr:hypothetical protein AN958_08482 [Leucoagaricus sp. SymC.cos]